LHRPGGSRWADRHVCRPASSWAGRPARVSRRRGEDRRQRGSAGGLQDHRRSDGLDPLRLWADPDVEARAHGPAAADGTRAMARRALGLADPQPVKDYRIVKRTVSASRTAFVSRTPSGRMLTITWKLPLPDRVGVPLTTPDRELIRRPEGRPRAL